MRALLGLLAGLAVLALALLLVLRPAGGRAPAQDPGGASDETSGAAIEFTDRDPIAVGGYR